MDDKIVAFCGLLRQNGLRVSVSETMDALRALGLIGLEDRSTVRAALRASAAILRLSTAVRPPLRR